MSDAAPTVDLASQAPTADTVAEREAARQAPAAIAPRPYPPSWLNVLISWIERLPGPPWVAFLAIGAITIVIANAQAPLAGRPMGLDLTQTYYAILFTGILWLIHYLDHVAREALDTFRPAMGISDADAADLRYRLTVVPARGAAILFVAAILWTIEAYVFQAEAEGIVGLPPLALMVRAPFETLTTAIILVTLYHTLRQLRLVGQIHAMAKRIDLYQPAPLYAFSTLTARTGMGIFLLLIPSFVFVPGTASTLDYLVMAGWFTGLLAISSAAFVLPLQGMHGRIAAEKQHLEAEVGRRLTATTATLHHAVDQGDLSSADGLNKTLASLIAERELVHKLPTWPWQPGTVGAFVTAILLPIGLWLATRLLERVV